MSAAERAAEVLATHAEQRVLDEQEHCVCGWDGASQAEHQAEALAAAGLLAEPTDHAPCRNCGHPLSHPWIAEHGRLFPQQSDPETPDVACIWRDCRHDVNGVRCGCTDPAPTGELPF